MHVKITAGTVVLILATLIVLLLGKALPKLIVMYGHESLVLGGCLLATIGWIFVLSMFTDSGLFTTFGQWRSSWILWGVLLGPILFIVSGLGYAVSARLGFNPPSEADMVSSFQGLTVLMLLVLVVSLAVLEEWLFRGVVFDYLRSHSIVLAVIGSAAVFALYHISLFQLLPTFFLGVGLALMVVYFDSVWPAVVAHVLFNILGVLLATMGRYAGGAG